MRAVIYARYSTELQSRTSVEDQVRICRRRIEQEGWQLTAVYSDRAMSGASHLRPGYQKLLEEARAGMFDVVLAESIDRLSRDQEHIASLYKQLSFRRIPLVTIAEGEINELHVGLKGTMSALYLKDLAQKTHRGLEGRVRQGLSAGGIAYGYDIVRAIGADGQPKTGERAVNNAQADIVRQIFSSFASGKSPRTIASELNKQAIAGPHGVPWGASTIYGNWRRGTGILNNELYVGRLVWNRQRFVKDPQTGRRQAIPNPPEEWIIEDVPGMRIVDDELWSRVKARQEGVRANIMRDDDIRPERARRPKYLFSGLLKCGSCGGGYVACGKRHYACANVSNRGTCENRLTIRRDILEESVLSGLRKNLAHPDLLAAFMAEYGKEWNRLRREEDAARSRDTVELASIKRQLARIIDAVKNGFYVPSMKAEAEGLEQRKAELEASLLVPDEELPRLHPGISEIYRKKVEALSHVLNDEALRDEAAGSLRSLLSQIRLVPQEGKLEIELVGELAGILALTNEKSPAALRKGASTTVVAGARFELATFRL